jgi:hypothetical protein
MIGAVRSVVGSVPHVPAVLDLGATVAGWIGEATQYVVVGDEVDRNLAAAVPGAVAVEWDGTRLDLDAGSIDVVVAPAVTDVQRPGTVPPAEWWRLLAPGGRAVVEIEADPAHFGTGPLAVRDAVVAGGANAVRLRTAETVLLPGDTVRRIAVATFETAA